MIHAQIAVKFHSGRGIGFWSAQINNHLEDSSQEIGKLTGSFGTSSTREIELFSAISVLSLLPEGSELTEVTINSPYVLDGLETGKNHGKTGCPHVEKENQGRIRELWNTLFYLVARRNIAWKLLNSRETETKKEMLKASMEAVTIPQSNNTKFIAYTDGSCLGNPGKGGWGAAVEAWVDGQKKKTYDFSGFEVKTTNNRMELTSAIKVLEKLPGNSDITILTDSKYLYDGITGWIHNWKSNYWTTSSRKPVLNKDLWIKLDEETSKHQVKWKWVKGHSISEGNNRADQLATTAAREN